MANLKMPKMIIFDYGHTLVYEDKWDGAKGTKALLEYAVSNKNKLSPEQINEVANDLFSEYRRITKGRAECHQHQFNKLLYEYLEIEINLSPTEIENIFFDNACPAHAMPFIKETLDYLHKNNIRTGVISNIAFSGEALKNRINNVIPNHNFEFIITSSEYIFRKPHKIIFEIAVKKANLAASEVWYCGDSIEYDISGANSAGIFPVWYESEIECWYMERGNQKIPDCGHLHIRNWRELIEVLSKINIIIRKEA